MPKKKKIPAEFRYYELPHDEAVLALTGSKWIQVYGENIDNMHFHNLLEIGYCHYGDGELAIEEDTYRFGPDMISCIPENVLHVTRSDPGIRAFWEYIYIDPRALLGDWGKNAQETKELLDRIDQRAFFIRDKENPMLAALIGSIFDEIQQKKAYHQECIRGIAYALLFEIARFNGREEEQVSRRTGGLRLESALLYVEKNYSDNFRVADMANECHMSETHFRRIFQEKMNMTPVEYVNFVRVKKACELIDKTDISMEDVAERVGFVTPSTFNRNFRRIVGTSPYQWKKRPDNHEGRLLEYKISALKGW